MDKKIRLAGSLVVALAAIALPAAAGNPSTVIISAQQPTVSYGQAVALEVAVTIVKPVPTGTIEIDEGNTQLAAPVMLDSSGKATFNIPMLSGGIHTLTALYIGDSYYEAGEASVTQTVAPIAPLFQYSLLFDGNTETPAIFSFSVSTPIAGGAVPTGLATVTGDNLVGDTQFRLDAQGAAEMVGFFFIGLETPLPSEGLLPPSESDHETASYSGDKNYTAASKSDVVLVQSQATQSWLTTSAANVELGSPITLTASVIPSEALFFGAPGPVGRIDFTDGDTSLGIAALDANSQATLTVASLPVGLHTLRFNYATGSANFLGSAPEAVLVTVAAHAAVLVTSTSATSTPAGAQVSLNASVTAAVASQGSPTGSVNFFANGTSLGAVSIDASGAAAVTTSFTSGPVVFTATYSGDASFASETSQAIAIQLIAPTQTGAAGPAGPTGATGAMGAAGATGAMGAVGATGPMGATGIAGAAGPAGATGAIGATGAAGSPGTKGDAGTIAVYISRAASLQLAAGTYAVQARAALTDATPARLEGRCYLTQGSVASAFDSVPFSFAKGTKAERDHETVVLFGAVSLTAAAALSIICDDEDGNALVPAELGWLATQTSSVVQR